MSVLTARGPVSGPVTGPVSGSAEDGLRRSARLMRALGPEAAPIWAELDAGEARLLTEAMDAVGSDLDREAAALNTFLDAHREPVRAVAGPGHQVWDTLSAMDADSLKALLGEESPQTLAYILSRLSADAAARLLRNLRPSVSIEAMRRMLRLGASHPSAIEAMEAAIARMLREAPASASTGGHQGVARIFDHLDSRLEKAFLAALDKSEPGAGQKVRDYMFTFDDLAGLGPGGVQTLLSRVDRTLLVHALKGAAPVTANAFFGNMTQRAGTLLKEEIAALGPVRRSDVDAARAQIVSLARALIKAGDIRPGSVPEDDELVD